MQSSGHTRTVQGCQRQIETETKVSPEKYFIQAVAEISGKGLGKSWCEA